jgi:hypothetical protein
MRARWSKQQKETYHLTRLDFSGGHLWVDKVNQSFGAGRSIGLASYFNAAIVANLLSNPA